MRFPRNLISIALASKSRSAHRAVNQLCHWSGTVDTNVLEAVQAAVAAGEAESVSAYVNDALRLKAEHDRRLRGIDDFIAAYEAEHGEITEEEMEAAYRRAKARAIVVRGGHVVDDKGTGAA